MRTTGTPILMAGLPGKTASVVAQGILKREDFRLVDVALSGQTHGGGFWNWEGTRIYLMPPASHEEALAQLAGKGVVAVDFTRAAAVNRNAELYIKHGISFVMGTTGGDRKNLVEAVKSSEICAVIAPNMNPYLVVVRAMVEWAGKEFPGALTGFTLRTTESHQETKGGVSGTAVDMEELFTRLGAQVVAPIVSIRDPQVQTELGIKNRGAHGYH